MISLTRPVGAGVHRQFRHSPSGDARLPNFVKQVVSDVLRPTRGVPLPAAEQDETLPTIEELTSDPPPERRARSLAGWLIDIEEQ
jgi:hypothetical protein